MTAEDEWRVGTVQVKARSHLRDDLSEIYLRDDLSEISPPR
jgi:hypothetical protein